MRDCHFVENDSKQGRTFRVNHSKHPLIFAYCSQRALARACEQAGIDGLRLHDLRHEATSRLFEKGLVVQEVASITGHTDWKSLQRYTHPDPQRLADKLAGRR